MANRIGKAVRTRPFIFMVLGLLLSLWTMPVRAQEVPPLPHAFFGNLLINGSPAPIGTRVEARGTGVLTGIVGNPLTTTVAGKYGGPDLLDGKLIVQGNIAPDAQIRFYVNGIDAVQTGSFRAGETKRLDLAITTTAGAVTTTSSTTPPSPPEAGNETNWLVVGGITAGAVLIMLVIILVLRRNAH